MNNQKSRAGLGSILFVIFGIAAIVISWVTRSDLVGFGINAACVCSMLLVIAVGFCGISRKKIGILAMCSAADELIAAKEVLRQAASDPQSDLEEILNGSADQKPLFQNEWLNEAFTAHRTEVNRLYRDNRTFRYVDIADHMNEDLMDEISFSSFNDLIGGTMTGIGILGTFIGLIVGLRNFDPSTADSMMQTIPILIDGIKIAFLTSIFGVVFSIFFNFIYRRLSGQAEQALESFVDTYYMDVLPRPENDGFTQLVQYQEEQSRSMSQLAEQISLTMANALNTSVVPTFQKIEATIDQLSDRLAETQNQNMGRIADEFVKNMDKSMGNQLAHLGEHIEAMCQWQDSMVTKMNAHLEAFQEAGDRLTQAGSGLDDSIQAMDSYVQNMKTASGNLQSSLEAMEAGLANVLGELEPQQKTMTQILETEGHVLESMEAVNQRIAEREEKTLQTTEQLKANMDTICETVLQNLRSYTEGTEKVLEETQQMAKQFETTITDISDRVCKSLQEVSDGTAAAVRESIQASAAEAVDTVHNAMNAQLDQIQERMEKLDQMQTVFVDSMHNASDKMVEASDKISETAVQKLQESADETAAVFGETRNIAEQLKASVAEISESAISRLQESTNETIRVINEAVRNSSTDTFELIKKEMDSQISQIQANMNSINQTQSAFIGGMDQASKQLTQASKQISEANVDLTANLDKAMSRTYQEFDRQLTEITRHLSGTITGIREVTEQVPRMLNASADQTRKITTNYLTTIAESQKQILTAVKSGKEQHSGKRGENQ